MIQLCTSDIHCFLLCWSRCWWSWFLFLSPTVQTCVQSWITGVHYRNYFIAVPFPFSFLCCAQTFLANSKLWELHSSVQESVHAFWAFVCISRLSRVCWSCGCQSFFNLLGFIISSSWSQDSHPLDPPTPVSASPRASVLCMNGPSCFHFTLCFFQQGNFGLRQALQLLQGQWRGKLVCSIHAAVLSLHVSAPPEWWISCQQVWRRIRGVSYAES